MKYVKIFFITTILLSTGTIFNASYNNDLFAYTTEEPSTKMPQPTGPTTTIPTEEIPTPEAIAPKEEKTALEEWKAHLATLSEHWDKANNIPDNEWKIECFRLAENVLEHDKSTAETLKSDFLAAINQQTTQITQAILDLIKEFDEIITAKLASLENKEKTEVVQTSAQKTKKQEEITPFEPLPTPAETTPAPETTPESNSAQTSTTTTAASETQGEDQLLQQWNELLAAMEKAEGNEAAINTLLDKANTLAVALSSAGKKTKEELQTEFRKALEILGLKKKFRKDEVKFRQDVFDRALFPEKYQQAQQFEYQQQLATEQEELQKFREEMATQEAAKAKEKQAEEEARKKKELATQASLLKLEQEGKKQKAETVAQIQALEAKIAAETRKRELAEAEAKKAFTAQITQPIAKKVAAEQKPAAEQGIFRKAIKAVTDVASNVKNWWYGMSAAPAEAPTTLAELEAQEHQEIEELEKYLKTTTKNTGEQHAIINLWKNLQQVLRKAPQHLDQYSIEFNKPWINDLEQILTELIITHDIITIDQACAKVKNALPLSATAAAPGADYAAQMVQKIKIDLEHIAWQHNKQKQQEKEHKSQLAQQRRERKEQIMLAQQKIKNEEDRIEAEKKKQLLAAGDYKNHKKEWNKLLAQLSQNTQATTQENHAHTMEAIKKSQALLQLAHIIPSKNKQAVSQKLKQNFTIALLDQQRFNDTKLNIHHNMDQFNKEINRIME